MDWIRRAIWCTTIGQDLSNTCQHPFQRLSVALWRGNAAMWATRCPSLPPSLDGME